MRVILAAGGSGGHIFPSVALASELEKAGVKDIFFVSSKRRLDRNILKNRRHTCFFLSVNPMPLGFSPIRSAVFVSKLFLDTAASLYLIARLRPHVVVGFGGYSSGTIVGVARMFGIPVLIHEQNLVPGRANRILSRVADRVAVSFKDSTRYFTRAAAKVVYSGNPLRLGMLSNDRIKSAGNLGLSPEKLTVLIMGGSQGASFLNRTASGAACHIKEAKGDAIQFIHLTGKKDYEDVKRFYEKNRIPGRVFSFLERIGDAYAASDLAISRAGAAAIFELALYAKAMILIPYPNPENNQRFNAMYFSRAGAAVYKEEDGLSQDDLAGEILGILMDEQRRGRISHSAGKLGMPAAGRILAEEVMKLGRKKTK
ncbi:MAG: undecaprenyldiphospho-muramoylpentapeptide beta-N-acetylglucosaminyltransferase [Candidatus Makaraimicrobium thalassicum]|nr:MAG: undecaprenyldiphospho-muramoylpentapeptide beta-N-acetylglucosaminyltransferase [Candidatus Omnitrophota bacterium]